MRTIALSLIRREHAYDFADRHTDCEHPMDRVTHAFLRFREHNVRAEGVDLERVVLLLSGNLPNIGLDSGTEPYDWERKYAIWGSICCREGPMPFCKRAFAIMINADHADQFESDVNAVLGDQSMVIGALTSILTGCRERHDPPMVTTWPDDDQATEAFAKRCVLVAIHVNTLNRGAHEGSCWRVVRDARVTKTGVIVGEREFNGFAGLQRLALSK